MPIAMYTLTVPVFDQQLAAHSAILDKAATHAATAGIDATSLMNDRLYPDMFPFWLQVRSACDHAANATARLTGVALPVFDETPMTFDGLKARIASTIAFVNAADPAKFEGAEARTFTLPINGRERTATGLEYFLTWALPNFYFHLTTAYGILRKNGVPIGKRDFIGNNG
jgi:hypothetical protein